MKKKILIGFCSALMLFTVACSPHGHTYDRSWESNETHHWKEPTCGCDVVSDYAEHVLGLDGFCVFCERALTATSGVEYAVSKDGKSAIAVGFLGGLDQTKVKVASKLNDLPVTEIGEFAFEGQDLLASIALPETVTKIGEHAFSSCSLLSSVEINGELTEIGAYAFNNCYALSQINLPESLTDLGEGAFLACESLVSVKIPDNLTTISRSAFSVCRKLTEVAFGKKLTKIGKFAFAHCEKLSKIQIPDGVTEIGESAFNSCRGLRGVVLPKTVTKIGASAFDATFELVVYYEGTQADWLQVSIGEGSVPEPYYYSEAEPALNADGTAYEGRYWRYVDGEPAIWTKEEDKK